MDVIPPPEGLNVKKIRTHAGLRAAIEREAAKLRKAKKAGTRATKDTIRLIAFLASEIRRRIERLNPEEKVELQRLRDTAEERDLERRAEEFGISVDDYIGALSTPGVAVRFSEINELEDRFKRILLSLDEDPETYAEILENMNDTMDKLQSVKKEGKMLSGLRDF